MVSKKVQLQQRKAASLTMYKEKLKKIKELNSLSEEEIIKIEIKKIESQIKSVQYDIEQFGNHPIFLNKIYYLKKNKENLEEKLKVLIQMKGGNDK